MNQEDKELQAMKDFDIEVRLFIIGILVGMVIGAWLLYIGALL